VQRANSTVWAGRLGYVRNAIAGVPMEMVVHAAAGLWASTLAQRLYAVRNACREWIEY